MGAAPRDLHYLLHHLRRAADVGSAWLREGSAILNGRGGFNVGWQSGAPSHLPACVSTNHLGAGTASLSRAPEGQSPNPSASEKVAPAEAAAGGGLVPPMPVRSRRPYAR